MLELKFRGGKVSMCSFNIYNRPTSIFQYSLVPPLSKSNSDDLNALGVIVIYY